MAGHVSDRFRQALVGMSGEVGRLLLGEPNNHLSSAGELRWGKHGSLSCDIASGCFYDHEGGAGGGVMWLIEREQGLSGRAAIDFLRNSGFDISDDELLAKERGPKSSTNGSTHSGPSSSIVATYDYVDENGVLVFQVVRFEPKTFRQRRRPAVMDAPEKVKGGWVYSVAGVRQVPYRLPELIRAVRSGEMVFCVEGEKDADNLAKIGLTSTCNAMGAGKWSAGLSEWFSGADVLLLPDNDPQAVSGDGKPRFHDDGRPVHPGQDHMAAVGTALGPIAQRVRVLELPDLPPKGDVSDWLEANPGPGQADKLCDLADKTAISLDEWLRARDKLRQEAPSRFGRLRWRDLDIPGPELEFLIDDFMTEQAKIVIGGEKGSGKSFLALHAALSIARGVDFFGRPVQQGLVIYQAGEGALGLKNRARAYRKHYDCASENVPFELLQSAIDLWRADGDTKPLIAEIRKIASEYTCPLKLVVIDTLSTATAGADENSVRDISQVLQNVDRIALETGAAVCLVHHMNAAGSKLRGHTSIGANVDQIILVECEERTRVRTVILDKMKDGEDKIRFQFELLKVHLGHYRSGREKTSCVVVPYGEKADFLREQERRYGFKHAEQEAWIIFRALLTALKDRGIQSPACLSLPLGTRVVNDRFWREEYIKLAAFDVGDISEEAAARRKVAIRKALERAAKSLVRYGVIGRTNMSPGQNGEAATYFSYWTGKEVAGFPETWNHDFFADAAAAFSADSNQCDDFDDTIPL